MHADVRRQRLSSVTRPTPLRDPISFFAAAHDESTRALWLRPQTGEALVGLGVAAALSGSGRYRFRQIVDAWHELSARAVIDGGEPVLLGGFSFDPLQEPTALWDGFLNFNLNAEMVLPRELLSIRQGAAQFTTNVIDAAPTLIRHSARPAQRGLTGDAWQDLVRSVEASIRHGDLGLQKVVLATSREVHATANLESALRNLAASYPSCTIFAFAHGKTCFLGATPERLIAQHNGVATTMALAASAPRGTTPIEDARIEQHLLTDPKERAEHAIVVSAIRDGLSAACERVIVEAVPRVRKLENVQHLMTTIRGQLEPGRSVLDLVEQLHPTPAVGGSPREAALEFIREREALDRGWYAAPVGWMDLNGNGDFVVAIRSALVHADSATLFAGCGIVAGSDPRTEYAELGWKLRPMLTALGVSA